MRWTAFHINSPPGQEVRQGCRVPAAPAVQAALTDSETHPPYPHHPHHYPLWQRWKGVDVNHHHRCHKG
eukprot:24236-Eustigmatos_ZCMA.PRE.1